MSVVQLLRAKVNTLLTQHFLPKDHFILAISGGLDSMVLLDIFAHHCPERCTVITIDHHLRSTSKDDTDLVQSVCRSHHIACFTEHIDTPRLTSNGKAVEETARRERYRILEKIRQQKHAQAIVTAHHAQDQAETQIMHLLRGSNLQGLIGMHILNKQHIFRPLLGTSKEELKLYANEQSLLWHEDETNLDTKYLRNHIRQHWCSLLETALKPISTQAQLLQGEIDALINQWELKYGIPQQPFTRTTFYQLELYLRLAWIHKLLAHHFQLADVTALWVGNVYHWLESAKQGSRYTYRDKTLITYHEKQFSILQ